MIKLTPILAWSWYGGPRSGRLSGSLSWWCSTEMFDSFIELGLEWGGGLGKEVVGDDEDEAGQILCWIKRDCRSGISIEPSWPIVALRKNITINNITQQ